MRNTALWVTLACALTGFATTGCEDDGANKESDDTDNIVDSGPGPDADPDSDTDRDAGQGTDTDTGSLPDAVPQTVTECFADAFYNPDQAIGPDYDQYSPKVGSHCMGTNHQDIAGVERVVFLGDSVTVGSPPTPVDKYYRSQLADMLAGHFGLVPPDASWKSVNPFGGTSVLNSSGDFASCARWGARTDDFVEQIENCFPENEREKTTLVIMTMGGNDVSPVTQAGIDGTPIEEIWQQVYDFVQLQREAIEWFYEGPSRFPNGVFVIFANPYEFTDGTGEVTSCPAAGIAGFGGNWDDPSLLVEMAIWWSEEYLKIAVDTGADMLFLLEHFCGHGYKREDPSCPCYRGPGSPLWFDLTCIHPNPEGHTEIANMFMAVVEE